MTIGAIIFPIKIPNLNQTLFKGVNSLEFIAPNTKKIRDIAKDQNLIWFSFNKGQIEIIKKIIKKTIPKFLFVGILIFFDIIIIIITYFCKVDL